MRSASAVRAAAELVPFVPRLTVEWLQNTPELRWLEQEGTLAFVDISGFTAMSERLSNSGRAGAEEVTEVMNATFSALLEVAYGQGGGLLKFGGDALLLLYDGDDHAARAARAAFEMRRTLRAIGRPRTSAGSVTLKMHAGLHSGCFQFFLVGGSHRELLVTGPAATRVVEMEAASEAGEILVSPETAGLLEAHTLGEEKASGTLLVAAPAAEGELRAMPDVGDTPIEVAVPAPLRAQLLDVGPLEGEHRHAAVAFIRYAGTDEVVATEGAAAAAEALEVLMERIQAAADEYQVTVLESDVDRDGGRIILVAGAPQTFGDDEERLLRTLRAAVDSGLPLPVSIGVSEGRVFTGQVGATFRRTYTILGDTAALAARLMARAGEDEIWVSASAFSRGGRSFAATELEPFQVKGKAEPVHAVVLGDLLPETEQADDAADDKLPFVDRERERAVLAASVAPVRMGFGTLVELIGEPGIGKSRLADELRAQCGDMKLVTLRCEQYESSTPYQVFRPFLRALLDVPLNADGPETRTALAERLRAVDEALVPWAPLLGAPLDVEVDTTPEVDDLDPAFRRARLHGVVGALLGRLLGSPTLLVFEDVHWMDDASTELLRHLGTQLPTRPWLTCTTRRSSEGGFLAAEGTPPLPALTLRLEPLPPDDAKSLIRAAAGDRELDDAEVAAIFERGAGNPLFLQELALPEEAGGAAAQMPDTVEALVATRIDRLAPADRALLRWASVLGTSFSGAVITDVLEGDPSAASDSEAWDRLAEFVERDPEVAGGFRFRHALIRDGAYEGLSYRRRRELHGRVADVIERREGGRSDESAELLSLHYYRAERWPETWRYSVEAARRAEEKYANVETAQFLERGLEAAKAWAEAPGEEVARVWELLGDVRMRMAAYEDAASAYKKARAFWRGDPVQEARLIQQEALVRMRLGNYSQALRRLTQALRLVEGVDGDAAAGQRAHLYNWYAGVLQYQWRPSDAIDWCKRAIAEAERSGAQDALAQAYFSLDWAYLALGRRDEAVNSPRAVEIYERLGALDRLAWALNIMGGRAYLAGRWEEAIAYADRARTTFVRIGDEMNATVAALNVACIRSDQGRMNDAEPLFRHGLELRRAGGNPLKIADGASELGRFAGRIGSFDEAHALLAEARELFSAEGDDVELLAADVWRVECFVLEGASAAALELADDALARATMTPGVAILAATLHRLRGWAFMQLRDLENAGAAFEESLSLARLEGENIGMRSADYELALTLDALEQLGDLVGQPTADLERERDAIVARLAVLQLTRPPLPH
ncbi:MAG: AAA family ATPase [Gaiellaceae bacterium]|jgi:class 3 adenylate cyclase/tetratricopeptide (TPR) repeat protein